MRIEICRGKNEKITRRKKQKKRYRNDIYKNTESRRGRYFKGKQRLQAKETAHSVQQFLSNFKKTDRFLPPWFVIQGNPMWEISETFRGNSRFVSSQRWTLVQLLCCTYSSLGRARWVSVFINFQLDHFWPFNFRNTKSHDFLISSSKFMAFGF